MCRKLEEVATHLGHILGRVAGPGGGWNGLVRQVVGHHGSRFVVRSEPLLTANRIFLKKKTKKTFKLQLGKCQKPVNERLSCLKLS